MSSVDEPIEFGQFASLQTSPPLVDQVTSALKLAILSGEIKPHTVLVERQIAQSFGVSKTPVREALINLTATGIVEAAPGGGTARVRKISDQEVRWIYEARLLVEPWAIGRGVEQHGVAAEARSLLSESRACRASNDLARLSLVNRQLHRVLYQQCDNQVVVDALNSLQDLTALCAATVLWERFPYWESEATEHEAIVSAAERRDSAAAASLAADHILRSIDRLDQSVRDRSDRREEPDRPAAATPAAYQSTNR